MTRKISEFISDSLDKIIKQRIFTFDRKKGIKYYKQRVSETTKTDNNTQRGLIPMQQTPGGTFSYFYNYQNGSTKYYPRIGLFYKMFLNMVLREEEILKVSFSTLAPINEVMIPTHSLGVRTTMRMSTTVFDETTPKNNKPKTGPPNGQKEMETQQDIASICVQDMAPMSTQTSMGDTQQEMPSKNTQDAATMTPTDSQQETASMCLQDIPDNTQDMAAMDTQQETGTKDTGQEIVTFKHLLEPESTTQVEEEKSQMNDLKQDIFTEKSSELPPPQKCRLSCPLPPPEFCYPFEVNEFRANYQSPNVRFLSLPEQFLPKMSRTDSSQQFDPSSNVQPKMKALLFEPKTLELKYDAVDAPVRIFKDEILVEVAYSGVCGTDLFITEGKVSCGDQPIILGHEISGRVYAVGKDVDHVMPGDKVAVNPYTACNFCRYCSRGLFSGCQNEGINNSIGISRNGGWAEFVVLKKSQVHKVPDQLQLDQAALIQPLSCVLSAMSKLKILHEMDILIQGLGLNGCLWASVLHSQGHKNVIVCDKTSKRRSEFNSLGTNYPLISPKELKSQAVDLVVECTGSQDSIERSLNALNPNGQICFFAKPQPVTEIRFYPYEIIQKEITIVGNTGNAFHFSEAIDKANIMKDRYLDFDKLGVRTFDLENFREAFQLQKSKQVSKIIFKLES